VTGFVPDLNQYLNGAAVFVAPLRFAAGVQNKVLEAMAAGRPVVTKGAIAEGLGATPGRDLLVADEAPAMAARIVDLLGDEALQQKLGQAGRQFVCRNYRWDFVAGRMKAIAAALAEDRIP
jgi:glycosyltransferase involved in cell wall biosynthesis